MAGQLMAPCSERVMQCGHMHLLVSAANTHRLPCSSVLLTLGKAAECEPAPHTRHYYHPPRPMPRWRVTQA